MLKRVHDMNSLVAHFAGKLHDAISPSAKVDGAIFAHPDFEHLEME
jgi:hypothetical protein